MKNPSNRKKIFGILVALLAIILIFQGWTDYQNYASASSSLPPHGSSGFTFSSPHEDFFVNTTFVVNLYPDRKIVEIGVYFSVYPELEQNSDYLIGIFTPYTIEKRRMLSSENPNQLSWEHWNSDNGSLLLVKIKDAKSVSSSIVELKVSDPILSKNFGSYTLDIPFGSIPSRDVWALENNASAHFGSFPDYYVQLHVSTPPNAVLIRETEKINDRRYYDEFQLLEFNINELNTFILHYSLPNETNEAQTRLFWSGIWYGSGISLLVSESFLVIFFYYGWKFFKKISIKVDFKFNLTARERDLVLFFGGALLAIFGNLFSTYLVAWIYPNGIVPNTSAFWGLILTLIGCTIYILILSKVTLFKPKQ